MPELPGLPPRRVPPSLDPPAHSADRAVRRGAARRRRTAVSAATTFGIAGLAAAAVLQGPAGTRGGVDAAGTGTVPRTGVSGTISPTGLPSVAPAPSLNVSPAASGTVGPVAPSSGTSAQPSPDPQPSASAQPPIGSEMRREQTSYAFGQCQDRASARTTKGWCVNYVGALSGKAGRDVTLAVELCRLPGFGDGAASFPTDQEAEFTVSTDGPSSRGVWRWSVGRAFFPDRHSIALATGTCSRWSATWDVSGNDGRPLNPGRYSLLPDVLADNLADGDYLRESFAFTVT